MSQKRDDWKPEYSLLLHVQCEDKHLQGIVYHVINELDLFKAFKDRVTVEVQKAIDDALRSVQAKEAGEGEDDQEPLSQ